MSTRWLITMALLALPVVAHADTSSLSPAAPVSNGASAADSQTLQPAGAAVQATDPTQSTQAAVGNSLQGSTSAGDITTQLQAEFDTAPPGAQSSHHGNYFWGLLLLAITGGLGLLIERWYSLHRSPAAH